MTSKNADGSIKQKLNLDEKGFGVKSVGDIEMTAANEAKASSVGHKVVLKAGDGVWQ